MYVPWESKKDVPLLAVPNINIVIGQFFGLFGYICYILYIHTYYAMLCYTILYYTILFYTILYIHKCIYIIMKKIDTLVSYDIWLVSSRSGSESEKKFGQSGVRLATRQDVELGATHVSWTTRRSPWLGLVQANMGRSICASR